MKKILFFILIISQFSIINGQQADITKSNAIIKEGMGEFGNAAELFRKAIQLYKDKNIIDTLCVFKAGYCSVKAKKYNESIPFLKECINMNYNNYKIYIYLSTAYINTKQTAKAIETLEKGKKIYLNKGNTFDKQLALCYYDAKKYKKASEIFSVLVNKNKSDYNLKYKYALSLEKEKKYLLAANQMQDILKQNPDDIKVIKKIGVLYFKETDLKYQKEKKKYEAIKNPSRVDYSNSLKNLNKISQGFNKAIPYLEKALKNNPNNKALNNCLLICKKRLKQ